MNFDYQEVKEWPFFSWLVIINKNSEIKVLHGCEVETTKEFFCEAVWDGEFIKGDFDQTEIVFGSGARIRNSEIHFVSSGSTLDRLHHYITPANTIIVSNSLVCLLSYLDEKLDPTYENYYSDFLSISKGINQYKNFVRTLSDQKINLTYYQNLKWDGDKIVACEKKEKEKNFRSFQDYDLFLHESIEKIFRNADDRNRKLPLKKLGTISRGYDSPTITALAKRSGLKEVIAFDEDRRGNNDCGDDIARLLGVRAVKISREAWKMSALSEIPFIAAEGRGEDVQFFGIPDHLIRSSIFLTGYNGDKVWQKDPEEFEYSDELTRTSIDGLSLSEYRLWKGFIHIPVPFIGARQIRQIKHVSNLDEMKQWNVPGKYNRPICRRIVEGAGVPRNAFGRTKQRTTVELSHRGTFITEDSQKDLYSWLKNQKSVFRQKGKIFPGKTVRFLSNTSKRIMKKSIDMTTDYLHFFSIDAARLKQSAFYQKLKYDFWFYYLFPWAVENAKAKYKAKGLSQ